MQPFSFPTSCISRQVFPVNRKGNSKHVGTGVATKVVQSSSGQIYQNTEIGHMACRISRNVRNARYSRILYTYITIHPGPSPGFTKVLPRRPSPRQKELWLEHLGYLSHDLLWSKCIYLNCTGLSRSVKDP